MGPHPDSGSAGQPSTEPDHLPEQQHLGEASKENNQITKTPLQPPKEAIQSKNLLEVQLEQQRINNLVLQVEKATVAQKLSQTQQELLTNQNQSAADKENLQAEITSLTGELQQQETTHQEIISQKEAEINQQRNLLAAKQQELLTNQTQSSQEKENLQAEITSLTGELQQKEVEIERLTQLVNQQAAEINHLTAEVEEQIDKWSRQQTYIQNLEARIRTLESPSGNRLQNNEELQYQIEKLKEELKTEQTKHAATLNQLEKDSKSLETKTKEWDTLNRQIADQTQWSGAAKPLVTKIAATSFDISEKISSWFGW